MFIDKEFTLMLIKKKYGSISTFIDSTGATRALFYSALSLTRDLKHKTSKSREIIDRLDSEGLLVKEDSELCQQLKHIC